jgi:ABC-type transport system involved in multi-copper enzyme maturation permease subunit
MVIWTLAKKDLRLLLRDRRALVILLAMPVLFILVLGVSLGEGFGQKPDDRLRFTVLDLDEAKFDRGAGFPPESWAREVRRDLELTAGIRLEILEHEDHRPFTEEEARRLITEHERPAILVLGKNFSREAARCSFLVGGINPFDRDGVDLAKLDARLLRDDKQPGAAAIIEQVAQVSLLRVILPWMIGRAFDKIGDAAFLELLGKQEQLPGMVRTFLTSSFVSRQQKQDLGNGLQGAIAQMFPEYNLKGATWADLTKSRPKTGSASSARTYLGGGGPLNRGDLRYQLLVPSYTVMFAFFLVLTVGWLFVAERRQGTLKRLRAAPLSRTQILFGKMIPCFLLSLGQGLFLLVAGKLVFGMSWGQYPLWLLPVVFATSLAAMGMAMLVASLARTETQVAIYGTLLVLVLAGVSGCLMPRELMPEQMKQLSRVTPHAWALDAYTELLSLSDAEPNLALVGRACLVLVLFGVGFTLLAWWFLRLD